MSPESTPTNKDSLAEFREMVPDLIKKDELEQKEFVINKVQTLETQATHPASAEIDQLGNPVHKGYISKNIGVRRHIMVDPIYLDDNSVYEQYLHDVSQRLEQTEVTPDDVSRATLGAVQTTIADYTGNAYGYKGVEDKNKAFYLERSGVDSEPISIKEFKHKGIAVCAEKAALAQNILSFAGFDSVLIMSRDSELLPGQKEAHAYNVLHTKRGYFLYDPTNLQFDYDAEGKISASRLAVYPISEEQYNNLLQGGDPVSVKHTESYKQRDGTDKKIECIRVYGSAKGM